MNHNKLYFIQTVEAETHKHHQCWLISSPSEDQAQAHLVEAGWVDINETIVISSEEVDRLVDTDEALAGQTYIKMHN